MRTEERKVRYYQFYEVGEMTRAKSCRRPYPAEAL